jgi:MinD-like ATPase involved in chromosome partitioning or flagellar assembly
MSDRSFGARRRSRLSAPRSAIPGVRVMSTGRWRPPLGETPLRARRAARVVAVGSALPRMGKSVLVSNLAVAMAALSRQVIVVDLDLGSPRLHALFGVEPPDGDTARATGIRNVLLWPGAGRLAEASDADARAAQLGDLAELDADVVIVDVGSANRDDLWNGFAGGAARLLVTTAERTALEATYAFLRAAALRADNLHGVEARAALARFCGGLVGNLVSAPEETETFHAFARLVREQLGIPLTPFGCLKRNQRVVQSVVLGKPLLARRGIDDDVRALHQIAELILAEPPSVGADCVLSGATMEVPASALPADLARYERKHPRFPVDWSARLELDDRLADVRVRDVSESGAAFETTLRLRVGDTARLYFHQIPGQPALQVTVRNVLPAIGRIGVRFDAAALAVARIMAAARERLATA